MKLLKINRIVYSGEGTIALIQLMRLLRLNLEGSLVDRTDLQALYFSGTYCHKTSIQPPSCQTPRQPTIYVPWNAVLYVNKGHLMSPN